MTVTVGTKFYYAMADGNPQWEVTKARGNDTWECVVTEESLDFTGTKKVFGTEEIRRAIAVAAMWQNIESDGDKWWQSRKAGEIVHYNNGFGQFVRGRIVWEVSEDFPHGRNVMVPTELVGNWRKHDLPTITITGELREGYHVSQIRQQKSMQPNATNMVECAGVRRGDTDPRSQPGLDLTPPTPTAEQMEAHRFCTIQAAALALLKVEYNGEQSYSETVRRALEVTRQFLNGADF